MTSSYIPTATCYYKVYLGWLHELDGIFGWYVLLDDQPTLTECIRFPGRERKINIPQEISIKYRDFGILLLDDRTGARLEALEHEHRCNAELINSKILQEWIAGKGKRPVSWKTLTEVLRDVELNTLAEDIDHVKCSWFWTLIDLL